jgi:hypothetical protein
MCTSVRRPCRCAKFSHMSADFVLGRYYRSAVLLCRRERSPLSTVRGAACDDFMLEAFYGGQHDSERL